VTDILITLLNSCQTALISNFDRKELFGSFVGSTIDILEKQIAQVMSVAKKNHFEEQAQLAGAKRSRQAP